MAITIFYSWQSDLKSNYNRSFIEEAIRHAIKESNRNDIELDINIDRDTSGEVGSPDIVATIFDKIKRADIFVGDISIINAQSSERKTPNPNVLIELGYAASSLGWDRIICIYNVDSGEMNDLPFDLRTRRILTYELSENIENKSKIKNVLSNAIQYTIQQIDPAKIKMQNEILREYIDERLNIKTIAIEKPTYWEYILTSELFKHRLADINLKLEELEKGLFFKRTILMNDNEFRDWLDGSFSDIERLLHILSVCVTKEIPIAHGEPGHPGDAIKIRKVINHIATICNNLISWEEELVAIKPSEELINAKKAMMGTAKYTIGQISQISTEFENMVIDLQKNKSNDDTRYYKISITINLYEGFTRGADMMIKYLKGD